MPSMTRALYTKRDNSAVTPFQIHGPTGTTRSFSIGKDKPSSAAVTLVKAIEAAGPVGCRNTAWREVERGAGVVERGGLETVYRSPLYEV